MPPRPRYNWTEIRDEYVTGDGTYESIAERLGVHLKTVEKHALDRRVNDGKTWGELRAEFREDVSDQFTEAAGKSYAQKRKLLGDKATDVALKALGVLELRIDGGAAEMRDADLVAAAKMALTVKVEVGGDPEGTPIDLRAKLDQLSVDELRRLAAP